MSNENFISEINDELRSDAVRNAWRRFGPWVIGAAVLLVVAVAVTEGWTWFQGSNAARSSDQFYEALTLADGADPAAANAALDTVEAQGSGDYPTLAKFRQAALTAKQGDTAGAVAAYDALSTTANRKELRDVALVLAAFLLVDSGDVAAVEQRVNGLLTPDNPMRNAAREAIGLVKYKAGDLAGARQSFDDAINDPLVDTSSRQRLQIFTSQLTAEGLAPVAAADAVTPSVGDAPELDTAPPADPAPAAGTPTPAN